MAPLRACSVLLQSIWIEGGLRGFQSLASQNPLQSICIENNQTSSELITGAEFVRAGSRCESTLAPLFKMAI
jgi:hypothetical protein